MHTIFLDARTVSNVEKENGRLLVDEDVDLAVSLIEAIVGVEERQSEVDHRLPNHGTLLQGLAPKANRKKMVMLIRKNRKIELLIVLVHELTVLAVQAKSAHLAASGPR